MTATQQQQYDANLNPEEHAYTEGERGKCAYCGFPKFRHKQCVVIIDGERQVVDVKRERANKKPKRQRAAGSNPKRAKEERPKKSMDDLKNEVVSLDKRIAELERRLPQTMGQVNMVTRNTITTLKMKRKSVRRSIRKMGN